MKNIKKLQYIISLSGKKETFLLLVMIIVSALLETLGVASILPFMTVLSNPELIANNHIFNEIFEIFKLFGVRNSQSFLFALGLLFFILLILSILFKAATMYLEVRYTQLREYEISKRLIKIYLDQPYSWFLNENSADLGKNILSEVNQVIGGGLKPLISLITKAFLAFTIIILLILVDLKITIMVSLTLGISYGLIFKFARGYLNRIGGDRLKSNQERYTIVNEAFGAVKEVKVGGLEKFFIDRFSAPAKVFATKQSSASVISQLPRFGLEIVAFGGIILLILYLIQKTGNFNSALPLISLYALASYRLLPAIQQIYGSLTLITFVGPSLDKLHDDLKNFETQNKIFDMDQVEFNNQILLKDISYSYPNSSRTVLDNINIKIDAKTTVGFVGTTGSGKTTTVDIILGLLEAKSGFLEVDGKIINEQNKRSWQSIIGYVPQQIYLSDDTISSNIAFGIPKKKIDDMAVKKAAKIANLHEFVINELPQKYETFVGERGVRLSGGQRQRIGIARALYHNPKVLILDEATNALDNQTEKAVMDAVNSLSNNITIILIAHRLNTVQKCDNIFLLEDGKIKSQGKFDDLFNKKI